MKGMPMRGARTAKSKMVKEYGGMEKYPSKAAMMKHEKGEGKKVEAMEKRMAGMKKAKK